MSIRLAHWAAVCRQLGLALLLLAAPPAFGEEETAPLPAVAPELAEAFLTELFARWNRPGMSTLLAADFRDRDRLLEALAFQVPADARLRLIGIGGIHTLAQERVEGGVLSTVVATVHAQVEYEDPRAGFQLHEGVADYVFRILRRAPR